MKMWPTVLGLLALFSASASYGAEVFRDCRECPEMVAMEPGVFRMGSPDDETGRAADGHEGPAHEVRIDQRFALGRKEVSVGEFRRFVEATGHATRAESDATGASCLGWLAQDAKLAQRSGLQWRSPGYPQTDNHPVVCVSWNDAQAYIHWLGQQSGHAYRLPREAEWEYAARSGSATSRPWGDDPVRACLYANVADEWLGADGYIWPERHACNDGHFFAAPVGSYTPDAFGLHDMIGNVWEWVQDCYDPKAYAKPAVVHAARADEAAGCTARGLRGGAWISGPGRARAAYRGGYGADTRTNVFGFRVARSL